MNLCHFLGCVNYGVFRKAISAFLIVSLTLLHLPAYANGDEKKDDLLSRYVMALAMTEGQKLDFEAPQQIEHLRSENQAEARRFKDGLHSDDWTLERLNVSIGLLNHLLELDFSSDSAGTADDGDAEEVTDLAIPDRLDDLNQQWQICKISQQRASTSGTRVCCAVFIGTMACVVFGVILFASFIVTIVICVAENKECPYGQHLHLNQCSFPNGTITDDSYYQKVVSSDACMPTAVGTLGTTVVTGTICGLATICGATGCCVSKISAERKYAKSMGSLMEFTDMRKLPEILAYIIANRN